MYTPFIMDGDKNFLLGRDWSCLICLRCYFRPYRQTCTRSTSPTVEELNLVIHHKHTKVYKYFKIFERGKNLKHFVQSVGWYMYIEEKSPFTKFQVSLMPVTLS